MQRPDRSEPQARLAAYVEALLEVGRRVNLTAARTSARAAEVLVAPSLAVARAWPRAPGPALAVDIGSGNGFPGVAVAACWPDCRVLLVERRGRKAQAIGRCLDDAGLPNVTVIACDARELARERPDVIGQADLVTIRAVGSLAATTPLAAPLLAPQGRVVHWKRAGQLVGEGPDGDAAARRLGLRRGADVVHGREGGVLVVYERPRADR